MALTQKQARDQYIVDSLAMFLDRNLKARYDPEALATAGSAEDFSTKIRIRKGNPTDLAVVLNPPSIAIDERPAATDDDHYAIGTAVKWRHMNFNLYCYPALRVDGYPSDTAAMLLKAYIRDVFSTESIRILDYSNPIFSATNLVYTSDNAYIVHRSNPSEINRFDITLKLKYAVIESLAT